MQETNKYDDIINMEHHTSLKHPPMDAISRAAQFAPFKALTGLEDEIEDTSAQKTEDMLQTIQREVDSDYIEYLQKEKENSPSSFSDS
ncbi:MAG: hypothetical protein K6F30_09530 [Lachnospiraceae bacterium]|nr:hypothetical protein [Lachnospiraceae bacterium]